MLLERDCELKTLHRLLGEAETSGGRVVLVRGEAGIGKSALVAHFLGEIEDRAHVLVGECDDLLTPQPFTPVWDTALDEPSLAEPLSEGNRREVMGALLALVSRGLRPTVVVFEDMQWADDATLDVTRFLGRRMARTHGLLVLTYRDGEVDTSHPLRMVIGALPPQNIVRMRLSPLSREGIAAMIGDGTLDVDEVAALSGGNPLLASEMITWGIDPVPVSIRDSVLGRAAKLSNEGRELLDLMAVLPGGAEHSLIARVLGRSPDEISECVHLGFLRIRGDAVGFRHELVRRAVESSLDDVARSRLNRRVMENLDEGTDPAVLAHHAREADDADGIVEHAPRAARAALAAKSHSEAREHFRTLERYLDRFTPADRAALLEDRARVERQVDLAAAADAVSRAIELRRSMGTDRELARALTLAVRIYEMARRHADADAAAAESVEILRRHPPDRDLASALGWTAWLQTIGSGAGEGTEAADEAVRAAEAVGDEQSIIRALMVKGIEMIGSDDPGCIEVLEDARRRAERYGYPEDESRALLNLSVYAQERHDLEWAIDLTRRGCSIAARHELPNTEAHARVQLAWALIHGGRWPAAHDILTEVLGSSGDPDEPHHHSLAANTELTATIARAMLHIRMGRPEADATLDRLRSLVEAAPWSTSRASLGIVTAERGWLSDQHDESAVAMLRDALDAGVRSGPSVSRSSIAFWLWELGELAHPPDGVAEPDRLLMDGRPTEAAALWATMGFPYHRALALMHGDDDERLEALRILEDLGAAATAEKLRRALRADGVRIPRGEAPATKSHPAGLTARQAEVLDLLAEGLSNPEIADRLFISERTAEHHVTAILTKLGVTTRYEAVDAARELGLLTGS